MWLRVDDKFPDHPKARGLDAVAIAVWLAAACWSAEYEQDGRVTPEAARQLAARFDPQESLLTGEPPVVARLVSVGLWDRSEHGYIIHDFLEYNPSKADLEKRRKKERSRRRKGYQDSVSARRRVARNVSPTTPHVASTRPDPYPTVPVLQEHKEQEPAATFMFWGKRLIISHGDLARWTVAYAPVPVLDELRRLEAWATENHRDYRDVRRFAVNNLSRAHERVVQRNGQTPDPPKVRPAILEDPSSAFVPMPPTIREQLRKLVVGKGMPA